MRYFYILLLTMICGCASGQRKSETKQFSIPDPKGFVSDFESFFSEDQKAKIIAKLDSVNKVGKVQIGFATFDSTYASDSLFGEFALQVAKKWGVGSAALHNGIFICISFQMKNIQIKTGLGIEKYITDAMVGDIVARVILPSFRQGKFLEGVLKAIDEFSRLANIYIKYD